MKIQNEFDMYIDKLKEIYNEDPTKATKEAHDSLLRMGYFKKDVKNSNGKKVLRYEDIDKLLIAISLIITALIGIFNSSIYSVYFFGLIFFIAGILISIYVRGFGLIFLFSHGMSGYAIMMGSLLSSLADNPILKDNPKNIYAYIFIIVTISIIGVIMSFIFNILGKEKIKRPLIILPLALYNIALFMAAILPKILPYVYNFKI